MTHDQKKLAARQRTLLLAAGVQIAEWQAKGRPMPARIKKALDTRAAALKMAIDWR